MGQVGPDDELGSSNLITPAKRKQALAPVKEGSPFRSRTTSPRKGPDATTILKRTLINVTATGSSDQYQYTGTYHGIIHSHLDAVDCHVMVDGKGYNGRSMEDLKAAEGCPKGGIYAQRNGVITRGVLFDATLLPGKAGPQGWLEPGTAIHREDLEALEKDRTRERCSPATSSCCTPAAGSAARARCMGPARGYAGYHADVAYFLKERGVSFIGGDASTMSGRRDSPVCDCRCIRWRSPRSAFLSSTISRRRQVFVIQNSGFECIFG